MPRSLRGQEVKQLLNRLAAKKLGKGFDCPEIQEAPFQRQAENLVAQIKLALGVVQLQDVGQRAAGQHLDDASGTGTIRVAPHCAAGQGMWQLSPSRQMLSSPFSLLLTSPTCSCSTPGACSTFLVRARRTRTRLLAICGGHQGRQRRGRLPGATCTSSWQTRAERSYFYSQVLPDALGPTAASAR